jgi:hypothetical protein
MDTKTLATSVTLAFAGLTQAPSVALAQDVSAGSVTAVFPDPSDFVTQLDVNGRCGSNFFHTKRAATNFKEQVAVILTAFTTGKRMVFFVSGCEGARNVISHGFVTRD